MMLKKYISVAEVDRNYFEVSETEKEGFYKVKLDLSIMEMQIVCRIINAELLPLDDLYLFWNS